MKRFVPPACLALTLVASPARAATIVAFTECVGFCATTTVMALSLDGNSLNVSMPARAFGDNAIGFNLAGSELGLVISNLSPGYTFGGTNGTVGPFGSFEFLIDGPLSVPSGIAPEISFTITRTGGFLSTTDVFEMNELGWWAAVHTGYTFPHTPDYWATNSNRLPDPVFVPEPASMFLLGTGLLAAFRVRKHARGA